MNKDKLDVNCDVSVILPCRDEEEALARCLQRIKQVFRENKIHGEIIVSDSSTDSSPDIAREYGAVLVKHDKPGYGRAYLEGFKVAKGRYFFCADPDGTYDFTEIPVFLSSLNDGYDFVIGNRFKGKILDGAMPWMHRYIGNPLLSYIFKFFFHTKIYDVHCGMRAFTKEALAKMNLKTTGMEFASEMVIKAIRSNLKIKELPINYHRRIGNSKLRSFSDGWRHLRFMLLYSPLFLFFIPGLTSFLLGILSMAWFYFVNPTILGIKFFFHPMFISAFLVLIGYQLIVFSFFAKTYAITHLDEIDRRIDLLHKYITIEKASILGLLIGTIGGVIFVSILLRWVQSGFGELSEVKNSIIALTLLILGIQTIFSSFMLSILGIKEE